VPEVCLNSGETDAFRVAGRHRGESAGVDVDVVDKEGSRSSRLVYQPTQPTERTLGVPSLTYKEHELSTLGIGIPHG